MGHGISGIQKRCENENIKIDMLMNPNDVLEPINHVFDAFSKMDLKIKFFDFLQAIYFWKPETKLEINQFEFLGSEVI